MENTSNINKPSILSGLKEILIVFIPLLTSYYFFTTFLGPMIAVYMAAPLAFLLAFWGINLYNIMPLHLFGWAIGILLSLWVYRIFIGRNEDYGDGSQSLKFKRLSSKTILLLVFLGFAKRSISLYTIAAIHFISPKAVESFNNHLSPTSNGNFIIILLIVVMVGPLLEEIMFRSIVVKRLNKFFRPIGVILIQALLFGIFHLNLVQGVYSFLGGIVYVLVVLWTGSLYAGIIVHASYNFFILVVGQINFELYSGLFLIHNYFTHGMAIIIIPILWWIYKNRDHNALDKENPYYLS